MSYRARWAGLVSASLLAGGLGACTELAAGSDTLTDSRADLRVDAESDASVPTALDPRWACLDGPSTAGAVALRPEVELILTITDAGTNGPPAGLRGRACQRLDIGCITPLVEGVSVSIDGALHLPLSQGFDGFIELTSPSSVSTMFFVNQPLMADTREAFRIINEMGLQALAASSGVTIDPGLGHLVVRAFDCEGAPASNVQLSTNRAGGAVFSFANGLPNAGADVTTSDGLGGFVNVPPGLVVVQGIELDGERISGTMSVLVREGWFTYGNLEPLPF